MFNIAMRRIVEIYPAANRHSVLTLIASAVVCLALILTFPHMYGPAGSAQSVQPAGAQSDTILYEYSIVVFRGRNYAIGGYFQNRKEKTANNDVYEITDPAKAARFGNRPAGAGTPAGAFKRLGSINLPGLFLKDAQFHIFNNRVYVIAGYNGDGTAWQMRASDDLLNWREPTFKAPSENSGWRHKNLGICNNSMYLAADTDENILWKSPDGTNWTKIPFEGKEVRHLYSWNGRLFVHVMNDKGRHSSLCRRDGQVVQACVFHEYSKRRV
jgi:hypothetical protein